MTWALLGLAVLCAPSGRRAPKPSRGVPPSALPWLAAVAAAVGCLALLGWAAGVAASVVVAPIAGGALARLSTRPRPARPTHSLALSLDLIAVALRAGQPLASALALGAPAAEARTADALVEVSELLRLGAAPDEAWRGLAGDPTLSSVAAAARRSAASGSRLAAAFEALAAEVRSQLAAIGQARAQRAGVLAMLPLGLCFLPAFVCVGIVPIVIGIARGVLTAVP
jgi:pilus assembly protein TadC